MSFIVRYAAELKAAGVEILQAACPLGLVEQVLGGLGQRHRLYDTATTWLIFLGQVLSPDHSCRNAVAHARASGLGEVSLNWVTLNVLPFVQFMHRIGQVKEDPKSWEGSFLPGNS